MPFFRLGAQPAPEPESLRVGTIRVQFVGPANVNEQVVRANMQLIEGGPLDDTLIDRDIRSLYRTGLFEFIEFKREVQPGRTINLVVAVTPKFRVRAVNFEGNEVRTRRLQRETETRVDLTLDERQVRADAEKIREYYQKSGYNSAQVDYLIERDRNLGTGTVTFRIQEGERVRISRIYFEGNDAVSTRALRKVMETRRWGIFSFLTDRGRLRDEVFRLDLDKLRDYYRELGHLDVEIDEDAIRYDYPSDRRLVLTIPVIEGRRYNVGEVTITGNSLYSTEQLMAVLRQTTGAVFAPSMLDDDSRALEEVYGREGYLDARARLIRRPNLATGAIDVQYEITESDQFFVESITIDGNTKTKSVVILRELAIGPGEVFNTVRMNTSRARLENTRFFDEVSVSPEATNIPGRRNLRISVKEGRTGNLTFGAGFSSLERAVIFAEVSQSNFDLFNRKSLYQGAGQKFRLRLQLGSRSNEVVLSFEEPWLFQQELALGFTLYRTSSDFFSDLYEEVRTGAEVYLRKRLFELVEGRLSYTYEIVEFNDVQAAAPGFIQNEAGRNTVSKIGFRMLRDTRDRLMNTTRGNRAELIFEKAGDFLGGDADYYKVEFRGAQYFKTFDAANQVISFIGRAGVVDGSNVPYFDQFFLGGPLTLRGFRFREVGNLDPVSLEPLGGSTYGFASVEYTFDLVSPIRFAVFYDAGFVNAGSYDFDPGSYNDNFGFGLRILVAGAPLSLDFGIPITTGPNNDRGTQFNFSFGTRF